MFICMLFYFNLWSIKIIFFIWKRFRRDNQCTLKWTETLWNYHCDNYTVNAISLIMVIIRCASLTINSLWFPLSFLILILLFFYKHTCYSRLMVRDRGIIESTLSHILDFINPHQINSDIFIENTSRIIEPIYKSHVKNLL